MSRRGSSWLADMTWAALCTAGAMALLLRSGGIWEHVNSGDLHAIFLPKYEYAARALLREHRLPLWNPNEFCGIPLLGVGHGGVLYPPVPVLFATLSPWWALQSLYAFHIFVLTWATTALLRGHGIGRIPAALAALVALVGAFRGVLLTGVDHPNFLASIAWIPVMLLSWENALRRSVRPWMGFLALASAAQWLAGYPDFPLDMPVLLISTAIFAGIGPLPRRLGILLVGLGLGAALAAVQILPLREAIAQSPRLADQGYYSLWRAAFTFFSPYWLVRRLGLAALALAAFGCWRPMGPVKGWLAAFSWSVFALNFPFVLLYHLPPYSSVRFPLAWSHVSGVFLGLLAASGMVKLWRRPARWSRAAAIGLGLTTAAHGLTVVWRAPGSLPEFRPGAPAYRAPDQTLLAQRAPLLRALQDGQPRILAEREATSGAALRYDLHTPIGHEGSLPPRRIVDLLSHVKVVDWLGVYAAKDWGVLAEYPDVGALLGIGIAVVPRGKAEPLLRGGFTPVALLPPDDLVVSRPALPRARLVHRVVEAAADEDATFAQVLAHAAEASRVAVVEAGVLKASLSEIPSGAAETVQIVRDEPEHVDVEATVAAPALLVLTDTYYPGWAATVDGVRATILRADHAFRGVRLEPGRHRIVFDYAPQSVRIGGSITALAGVLIVLLLVPFRPRVAPFPNHAANLDTREHARP